MLVKCVDDLTIRRDLRKEAESLSGWYRILSDDSRLLHLIMARCNPAADKEAVLAPIAELFNTELVVEDDVVRVADAMSLPIALAASLPGERERPCELITPPIESEHRLRLEYLLDTAKELGFGIPHEAAVHLHFDAEKLCNTGVFCRLIQVLWRYRHQLRQTVETNPHCTRLGAIPRWLVQMNRKPGFRDLEWSEACQRLRDRRLTKYNDFNVMNFVYGLPGKSTFEVRILPGSLDPCQIVEQARLFEAVLNWCVDAPKAVRLPKRLAHFMEMIEYV